MASISGRAAVVRSAGAPFEVVDVEFDDPGPGQVRVRMVATGLCHTDLAVQQTGVPFSLPGILGHEGAGIVESVGSGVTSVVPGDRVVLSFSFCGHCRSCLSGHPAYCETWFPLNLLGANRGPDAGAVRHAGDTIPIGFMGQSSFADYSLADENSVVKVAADADLALLAPLGCGVITGVGAVWNLLDVGERDVVAVYGVGGVGIAGLWAAAQRKPAMLIAIDRVAARLETARRFGATHTINGAEEDVAARLAELTDGRGTTKAFDTTAQTSVAGQAMDSTAIGGTVVVCGVTPPGTMAPIDLNGLINGKTLRGVTLGDAKPAELIAELIGHIESGTFPLGELQRRYPLDAIAQAAHDMHSGVTVKPVIVF